MTKLKLNMKNGDKFMIKLYEDSTNENLNDIIQDVIYKDYDPKKMNLNSFDLCKSESCLDEYCTKSISIWINVEEISSIEYGF